MIGLVRRQHVIIGADNGNIRPIATQQSFFIMRRTGGKSMRLIAGRQRIATFRQIARRGDAIQILLPRGGRARGDARGDILQCSVH